MLSIIIPVYNGEKYILDCLESIANQVCLNKEDSKVENTDIDVLLVDDGSTDNSIEISEKFLTERGIQYKVITKSNGGQGSARNRGLSEVTSELVVFVDQDDMLPDGILSKYLKEMKDADVLVCSYSRINDVGEAVSTIRIGRFEWSKYKIITPWAKCFRTDFLQKNNVTFLESMLGEDIYFIVKAYSYNPRIKILDNVGYYWRNNKKSVSNTIHKRLGSDNDIFYLFEEIRKLPRFSELCRDELFTFFIIKTAAFQVMNTLRGSKLSDSKKLVSDLKEWMRKNLELYDTVRKKCLTFPKGETIDIKLITWLLFGVKKS